MKTKIVSTSQTWRVSKGKIEVYIIKNENGYKIKTKEHHNEFIFTNYRTKESLKNALVVPTLIKDAVKFIEKNI